MKKILLLLLVIASALAAPQFNSNNAPDSAAPPLSASSPELAGSPGSAASPGFAAPENQPQPASPFGVTDSIQIGLQQGIGSIISSAFGNLASGFSG